MKKFILHSIAVGLAALGLHTIVACSSQEEFMPDESGAEVNMLFNVQTVSPSRSDVSTLTDNERMHNLRIVILHPDGTVEHNRFYDLEGAQASSGILLKVTPSETKHIFLFANEESVSQVDGVSGIAPTQSLTQFLDKYPAGASGFQAAVNDLSFQPDYTKNIPMSSEYEVTVPAKGVLQETFYIVRVATKFTVNFTNWRGENVQVNSFSIASHADRNFLMAHVLNTPQNLQLFNGKSWIDWLREVSDASSESDTPEVTDAAGWLKDYELPGTANKTLTYTHNGPITLDPPTGETEATAKPGKASVKFYLPESMNPKTGATDGEQQYTLNLKIQEGEKEREFNNILPNLKALFRNTHVIVNVTMYRDMSISVDVIPYSEVELKPDFGLGN